MCPGNRCQAPLTSPRPATRSWNTGHAHRPARIAKQQYKYNLSVCVCVCAWTKVKATSRQRGVWATLSSGSTTPVFHTLSCARSSENSRRIKSENLKKELNYKTIKKNIEQFNVLRAVYACCVVCVRCDLFKNQHTINELPGLAIKSISKLAYVNSKQADLPPTWGNFNLSANFVFFFFGWKYLCQWRKYWFQFSVCLCSASQGAALKEGAKLPSKYPLYPL